MGLSWYESDGTTAVTTTHAFGSTAAGSTSTAWEPWIYYNKGASGGSATNVTLSVEALSGSDWLRSGLSVLDQHEIEVRIKGYVSTGDATWVPAVTTLRSRMGANLPFEIGTIPGNCGVQLEIVHAPRLQSGTASTDVTVQFPTVYNEVRTTITPGANEVGGYGVLTGCGDPYVSEWVTAPLVTATGTPNDKANLAASVWVGAGVTQRAAATTVTLNQNDSAAAALTAGQAYYALLSQPIAGGAVVATKSTKATAGSQPVPALPANSLPIALVAVRYGAGGSTIATSDISQIAKDGWLLVADAGVLNVTVAPGRALTRRAIVTRTLPETLTVTDNATTTIYLAPDGTLSTSAGDFELARVTAASGDITLVRDMRRYIDLPYAQNELWTTLTEATATSVATIAFPPSSTAGADLRVWIEATDGTEYQSVVTVVRVASARKATGNTVSGIAIVGTDVTGATSGTLTLNEATVTEGAQFATVKLKATSSLTQTVLRANVEAISKTPGCIVTPL